MASEMEFRSPHSDLIHSAEFEQFNTGVLQTMQIEWEMQRELTGRSERSKHEIDILLGRIAFEVSMPNREDEFTSLAHALSDSYLRNISSIENA